jgi:hypothetical protein
MSSRQMNLLFAEEAVKHVETYLRDKAANKPEDVIHHLQKHHPKSFKTLMTIGQTTGDFYTGKSNIVDTKLAAVGNLFQNSLNTVRSSTNTFDPEQVKANGRGNCHEHAILAADYLKKKGIASNVYYVCTSGPSEWLDHVWVVIDIAPALADGEHVITLDEPPAAFGADAVVCDAWFGEWFVVQTDWARKMRSILNVTKVDPNQKVPDAATLEFTKKHG